MEEAYHSYILRMWRSEEEGGEWRASLQSTGTGELRYFSHLEQLFLFLLVELNNNACEETEDNAPSEQESVSM